MDEVPYPGPDTDYYNVVFTGGPVAVPPEFPALGSVATMEGSPRGTVTKTTVTSTGLVGLETVDIEATEFVTGNLIVARYTKRRDDGHWKLTRYVTIAPGPGGISWS